MQKENKTMTNVSGKEILFTRLFNAPRELVFEVWTNPDHLKHWWGPTGFTLTTKASDVRPGGEWTLVMHGPDGTDYPNKSRYIEVVKPERLVYEQVGGKKDTPAAKFRTTVTFEDMDGKTKVTMQMIFNSEEDLKHVVETYGAVEGGKQTLSRLEAHLQTWQDNPPFVIERTYNAPVARVWKAITDKEQMREWYFDIAEFKPEVGFEFQFWGGKDEVKKYLHLCKIIEVIPEKKLSHTWRYDGYEGDTVVTFELFGEGNKTRLRLTHVGLETLPASNPDFAKQNFAQGWTHITGISLKEYVEK